MQKHTTKATEHNFNPTSPITQKFPSTLIGGLGVTITDESENRLIGTNALQIVGVRHGRCDQTSSTRKDFLKDRERRRHIRRTGVMFSHLPTLSTYILCNLLLRTTQQSPSSRQTQKLWGVSPSWSLAWVRYPWRRLLTAKPTKGLGLISLLRSEARKKKPEAKRTLSKSHREIISDPINRARVCFAKGKQGERTRGVFTQSFRKGKTQQVTHTIF